MIYKAYTYLLKFKQENKFYYGVRFKNVKLKRHPEDDFMIRYTTSSEQINDLIKEYGIDSFEWEIRKTFDTVEKAVLWETKVLRRAKVLAHQETWYNANIAGHKITTPKGRKRISERHTGVPKSQDQKEKIRLSNIGKNKGRKHTEEHRQKNSEAHKGEKNSMYGPCSKERAANISKANKGKKAWNEGYVETRPEVLEKIKQAALNRKPQTKEQREKQAQKTRGKKRTPEQKERIRQGILRKLAEKQAMIRPLARSKL